MRYEELLKALDDCKGDGTWKEVSKLAGIHYDTVARIARRDMAQPSVQVCERISDALGRLVPKKAAA